MLMVLDVVTSEYIELEYKMSIIFCLCPLHFINVLAVGTVGLSSYGGGLYRLAQRGVVAELLKPPAIARRGVCTAN